MRVLICGGRDFDDAELLRSTLDRLHAERAFTLVIEGGALGADRMGGDWADARGIEHAKFTADWSGLGRKAGPIRNQRMLREGKPDLVIAFPGGKGTANMVKQARAAGVEVIEVTMPEDKRRS